VDGVISEAFLRGRREQFLHSRGERRCVVAPALETARQVQA
jgi:hypothetical protein